VKPGDTIELDLARGEVRLPSDTTMQCTALPANVLEILEAGGLVPKLKRELGSRSASRP
jgi:3-isopropylmalate dehydratase small subunit